MCIIMYFDLSAYFDLSVWFVHRKSKRRDMRSSMDAVRARAGSTLGEAGQAMLSTAYIYIYIYIYICNIYIVYIHTLLI